jgi:hypothetical protein
MFVQVVPGGRLPCLIAACAESGAPLVQAAYLIDKNDKQVAAQQEDDGPVLREFSFEVRPRSDRSDCRSRNTVAGRRCELTIGASGLGSGSNRSGWQWRGKGW